jgi:hypothetical protein
MRRFLIPTAFLFALTAFVGCGSPEADDSDADSPGKNDSSGEGEHSDHDHGDDHSSHGDSDMDKMKAELAKLSPEDAASAEKQHVCPVTDEMLGSMGAPIKVDVDGQEVWICCGGCKKKLFDSPEKYLAKLKE